jgi:hypothetical protein
LINDHHHPFLVTAFKERQESFMMSCITQIESKFCITSGIPDIVRDKQLHEKLMMMKEIREGRMMTMILQNQTKKRRSSLKKRMMLLQEEAAAASSLVA